MQISLCGDVLIFRDSQSNSDSFMNNRKDVYGRRTTLNIQSKIFNISASIMLFTCSTVAQYRALPQTMN